METKAQRVKRLRAAGRLGGLKGGPARAKKLSEQRRKEIGLAAVLARWAKSKAS